MATNNINTSIENKFLYDSRQGTSPIKKEMDRDAFLKILVTQLQYQDPTQPMQDKEFIAQMAQFSSLEQMNKVATSNASLFQINAMSLGAQMIGNIATYTKSDGGQASGDVSSVKTVDGVVKVQVGEVWIDLADVEGISKHS